MGLVNDSALTLKAYEPPGKLQHLTGEGELKLITHFAPVFSGAGSIGLTGGIY
jgi:hypothetical protein